MTNLLRIDSSLRINDSYSRNMGNYFMQQWKIQHPCSYILERDLAKDPIPHLTQQTVNGFFDEKSSSDQLKLSDQLIEELYLVDEILITCPMYNFGIPSSLKAYFDLIVRTQKTFSYDENGIKGLLTHKKVCIISTMGNLQPLSAVQNPLEVHLTNILYHIGITDIHYFPLDGMINRDKALENIQSEQMRIDQYFIRQPKKQPI